MWRAARSAGLYALLCLPPALASAATDAGADQSAPDLLATAGAHDASVDPGDSQAPPPAPANPGAPSTPRPDTTALPPPLAETTVVARPAPPSVATEDQAASASVITADRTPRSGESLQQLLSEVAGTAITRMGGLGASAFLSIRGSTWEQVSIYVDGVPLNQAAGGQVDLASIALGAIDRIEIYRAMSPIGFGMSALGGIVSITTRLPAASGASIEAGAGSFGTRFGRADAAYAGDRLRVYGAVHLMDVRGDFPYHWDNGTRSLPDDDETRLRVNNQLFQLDAVLRARLTLDQRRTLTLSLSAIDRQQGVPGFGTHLASEARLTTRRAIASLAYAGRDDLGSASRLGLQVYVISAEQRFRDPVPEIAFAPTDTRDRTTALGATVRASRALAPWVKLAGIVDGRHEQMQPHDRQQEMTVDGDTATRLFGATGAEAELFWSRAALNVIPSLRWEIVRDVRSGRTAFDDQLPAGAPIVSTQPLARVGLVQRPTDGVLLRANVGRYVRHPNFVELFGNNGSLLGDPALKPETAINGDVGAQWRWEGARASATLDAALFAAWVSDLIQFQQVASGLARPRNIGSARIAGVETSLDARVGRWGRLVGQFTFNDARDTSASTGGHVRQSPLRPRLRGYARPELRAVTAGPLRVGIYGDIDVTSGNYLDPANLLPLPARLLLGAGASLAWPRVGLRLTASLQNLTASAITDLTGFPLPGRALYVSLVGNTSYQEERTDPP